MAIPFNPPDWLIRDYFSRPRPQDVVGQQLVEMSQKQRALNEADQRTQILQQGQELENVRAGYDPNNPQAYWDQYNADREQKSRLAESQAYENTARGNYYNRMPGGGTQSPGFSKPPTGFRWKADGELEAIPGGPSDIKLGEKTKKEEGLKQAGISQANIVIGKVDQALNKTSGWSTGWGAKLLGGLPGPAKNLRKDVDTIKANLGFSQLQEMRRNSPTGGALGQIAVQELDMLQSTVSSLDTEQTKDQLIRNLGEVKSHFENWKKAVSGETPSVGGGLIKVRNKQTGQTGQMPASKFDPSRYEQL